MLTLINKKFRSIISVACLLIAISLSVNVSAATLSLNDSTPISSQHISDEIFDGYEGLETTVSGKVGFNYDLVTPDGKQVVLLGFNPYMTKTNSYYNSVYSIGTGWQIKLPYLDSNSKCFYRPDGYSYKFKEKDNVYSLINYPGTASLTNVTVDNGDAYCFEKADGSKEYFSNDGNIIKVIDAFKNVTDYKYNNGLLSKIIFSDNTFINFAREQSDNGTTVLLKYSDNTNVSTFATLNLSNDSENELTLDSIKYDKGNTSFNYIKTNNATLLLSYTLENEYTRFIRYNTNGDSILSSETTYDDGTSVNKEYFYNAQGKVCRLIDDDFAEEEYHYTQNQNGSVTTITTKICQGNSSTDLKTLNKYGQLTEYKQNGKTLKLKYNEFNAVSEEKEDDLTINYSFTPQGKVSSATFSDGNKIDYNYYSEGQLKSLTTKSQQTYYTQRGEIEKVIATSRIIDFSIESQANIYDNISPRGISPSISLLYNINSDVGVTNFHSYYNYPQDGFNCYSYAIGKCERIYNPGYFSGNSININSFSGIKYNVEQDQMRLSRTIYNATVSESIPAHSWKIALRIRAGPDYHFMEKGNQSSPWSFKSGVGGPVMQLLGGKNPNNVTWDQYYKPLFSSQYKVYESGLYNSSIAYMIIRD